MKDSSNLINWCRQRETMPGIGTIIRSLRTILNLQTSESKSSMEPHSGLFSQKPTTPVQPAAQAGISPSGKASTRGHTMKGSSQDPGARALQDILPVKCSVLVTWLQAPGRKHVSLSEKELCTVERLGVNKDLWNFSPFQLAIEIPKPSQEVGCLYNQSSWWLLLSAGTLNVTMLIKRATH